MGFVSDERVPITCDESPGNTIFLRKDLNDGEVLRMNGAGIALKNAMDGLDPGPALEKFRHTIKHTFVVGWSGPMFEGRPFSSANLDALSSDDPLNILVNEECMRLFTEKSGGPKATTKNAG